MDQSAMIAGSDEETVKGGFACQTTLAILRIEAVWVSAPGRQRLGYSDTSDFGGDLLDKAFLRAMIALNI